MIELATGYENLCDHVISPSESIAELLASRGVTAPITAIPTGVQFDSYYQGNGSVIRKEMSIPENAFVVGHLGRLAPEKNLKFLSEAVGDFLVNHERAHFLVIGTGPSSSLMLSYFTNAGLVERVHFTGSVSGDCLINAYHAMDVFAFASKSETQGMVLTEAMCAGIPVIALDAPGAREVVRDEVNRRLLMSEDVASYADALSWAMNKRKENLASVKEACLRTV